jgi:DNA-binding MarR family transcriptional regulator
MNIDWNDRLDKALCELLAHRQKLLRRLLPETEPPQPGRKGTRPRTHRGVTPEQYQVISILAAYGHGVPVKLIAEAIDLPHPNVTRTLDRLEMKGFIRRTTGVDDKRQVIVRLTLEGSKTARRLSGIDRRLKDALWGKFSDHEKELLADLLSRE